MTLDSDAGAVLEFWFGPMADGFVVDDRSDLWFRSTSAHDANVRARFEPLMLAAAAGELDSWKSTAQGTLALVILLDQFSRNIYRGTDRAFAFDAKAQQLVEEAIVHGYDLKLPFEQRAFFYLPFEHQESLAALERCVTLFERLHDETPKGFRDRTGRYLRNAHQHRDVIRRFGRFPRRNRPLGRSSTDEEEEYLRRASGSFDQ